MGINTLISVKPNNYSNRYSNNGDINNSLTSNGNVMTSTVNDESSSANIINSLSMEYEGIELELEANGVLTDPVEISGGTINVVSPISGLFEKLNAVLTAINSASAGAASTQIFVNTDTPASITDNLIIFTGASARVITPNDTDYVAQQKNRPLLTFINNGSGNNTVQFGVPITGGYQISGNTDFGNNFALNATTILNLIGCTISNNTVVVNNDLAAFDTWQVNIIPRSVLSINTTFNLTPGMVLAIQSGSSNTNIKATSTQINKLSNNAKMFIQDGSTLKSVTTSTVTTTNNYGNFTNISPLTNSSIFSSTGNCILTTASGFLAITKNTASGTTVYINKSTNGQIWTQTTATVTSILNSVACTPDGSTILLGLQNNQVAVSTDSGATFTNYTIGTSAGTTTSVIVAYGGGRFVIMRNNDMSVWYSNTALSGSWTQGTNPNAMITTYITYINNAFVAVGSQSSIGYIMSSANGSSWSAQVAPSGFGSGNPIRGIAYSPSLNLYVAVGNNGKMSSSSDKVTWTAVTTPNFSTNSIYAIIWTGSEFVACGASGNVGKSLDGNNWTVNTYFTGATINSIGYYNNILVGGQSSSSNNVPMQYAITISQVYSLSGFTPALTSTPTYLAKGNQKIYTSVSATPTPNYVENTLNDFVLNGSVITASSTTISGTMGSYVKQKMILLNQDDIISQIVVNTFVSSKTPDLTIAAGDKWVAELGSDGIFYTQKYSA